MTRRVLWLSWDVGAGDGGLSRQSAGLATWLAGSGHDVVMVTRGAARPPRATAGVRVLAIPDPPAVMTWHAGGRVAHALAWANEALPIVVADRIGNAARPVLVVADGWQAGLLARPLADLVGGLAVQVLAGLEVRRNEVGDVPDGDAEHIATLERAVAHAADRVLVRGPVPADAARALGLTAQEISVLPFGVDPGSDQSGVSADVSPAGHAPMARPPASTAHRAAATPRPVVAVLEPRGGGSGWVAALGVALAPVADVLDLRRAIWPARAPDMVVVHDIERLDVAIAAIARGIPTVVGRQPEFELALTGMDVVTVGQLPADTAAVVRDLAADPAAARATARLAAHARRTWPWDAAAAALLGSVAPDDA